MMELRSFGEDNAFKKYACHIGHYRFSNQLHISRSFACLPGISGYFYPHTFRHANLYTNGNVNGSTDLYTHSHLHLHIHLYHHVYFHIYPYPNLFGYAHFDIHPIDNSHPDSYGYALAYFNCLTHFHCHFTADTNIDTRVPIPYADTQPDPLLYLYSCCLSHVDILIDASPNCYRRHHHTQPDFNLFSYPVNYQHPNCLGNYLGSSGANCHTHKNPFRVHAHL
jgi:hypothetical protein